MFLYNIRDIKFLSFLAGKSCVPVTPEACGGAIETIQSEACGVWQPIVPVASPRTWVESISGYQGAAPAAVGCSAKLKINVG